MKVVVLDIETTVQRSVEFNEEDNKTRKVIDNSPFNPLNKIVSVNWRKVDTNFDELWDRKEHNLNDLTFDIHENNSSVYYHNDTKYYDGPEQLQRALDEADLVCGQNVKYDLMWLTEAGFKLPAKVFCTYIAEYVLSRGVTRELSLEAIAKRREVTHKKSDLVDGYWADGIGFEAMPLPIVLEYADFDVLSCAEVFHSQLKELLSPDSLTLQNVIELMNDMLWFLIEIERNGIKIDLERLEDIQKDYEAELAKLKTDMQKIAETVMGDSPINLRSGVDISKVVYSRHVKDRNAHALMFNIGTNDKGKKLYPPRMTPNQFLEAIRKTTGVEYKTKAEHCFNCHGKGKIRKTKKDGSEFKKDNLCKVCSGKGYLLLPLKDVAGFKLHPVGPASASINGFVVDKLEIPLLIEQAKKKGNDQAVKFLTMKKRLNEVNVYLGSFVKGIKRWIRQDGLLHSGFNQCVTKTGRLSSSNPNFQNLPKGKKFPVRGAIVSRWRDIGGEIIEADFAGIEFVVAGELSRDPQIIEDILSGKDIHKQTASIVHQKSKDEVTKDERGAVKPHTFAPLYGAGGANQPSHIKRYYEEFFNIYERHGKWQLEQMDAVIREGKIRTPSGREYCFPGTRRIRGGGTTNRTNIVNWPVQGFATGDIMVLACVRALRRFKELGLKSLLVLTVHDSAICDVYPGELQQVCDALNWAMTECAEEIQSRWGYTMIMPLKCEMASGPTWMDGETLHANDNGEWIVATKSA